MSGKLLWAAIVAAVLSPLPARAAPGPADLPPAAAVAQALDAHPSVRMAMADARAAEAERERLRAGDYEFGVSLSGQRRDTAGGPSYNEWEVGLERGLRLPGKARLDARIGEQGALTARERVADARHEAARQLLAAWYAARKANQEALLWREQTDVLAEQRKLVDVRVRRGDAARLDLLQIDAAQAQAEAQSLSAKARAAAALADLRAAFPELPAPDGSRAEPTEPDGDQAAWQARALEHSHELNAARHELERARGRVERAGADRLPDPTIGLRVASEQGGDDRIVGLGVSVPIPGAGRSAVRAGLAAEAEARAEQQAAVQRRLAAGIENAWRAATASVAGWRQQEAAASLIAEQAELATRASALGEFSLADTLVTRRAVIEARLAAAQARLSANEAHARLLLDAHALWPLDGDVAEAAGQHSIK